MKRLFTSTIILFLALSNAFSQKDWGHLSGDFYATSQYYLEDLAIGANRLPGGEDVGLNTALSLNYTYKSFAAGIRYEAYAPPLLGFETQLEGNGLTYRFLQYGHKNFELTLGNFYEQFGSGLTLRSYYEPQLGLDNSIDGLRFKFNPKGMALTFILGKNRKYFEKDDSTLFGVNFEVSIADYIKALHSKGFLIDFGFSLVNKKEEDITGLGIPDNTLTWSGRLNLAYSGFDFGVEYASKGEEGHSFNNFSINPGRALFISAGYSKKGFGASVYWKFMDNMFFRSDRESLSNVTSTINYLPPNSNINTYRLMTLYPYATQGNGENGLNANVFYTIKKKTPLGGKYGTKVSMDFAYITGIKSTPISMREYDSQFLAFSDSVNYINLNVEVSKRVSRTFQYVAGFGYIKYNRDIIEGIPGAGFVKSMTVFTDFTYRLKNKKSIRGELQHMFSEQFLGSWLFALAEYGWSANWSAYISDEWNYDNSLHYYSIGFNYRKGSTAVGLSYVRERSGLICVGGICRFVPASNGARISINTSF